MSRKSVLIILMILAISSITVSSFYIRPTKGIVWIEGHIASDTIWEPADTYCIVNNTYVDPGVTLTIEPGVEVQFADGFTLIVEGSLNATGTLSNPIIFTSSRVTEEPPDPFPGAWNTITFMGNESEYFSLEYAKVTFAVHGVTVHSMGNAIIEESIFSNCSESGIMLEGESNVTIKENTITLNKNGITTDDLPSRSGIQVINNLICLNQEKGINLKSTGKPNPPIPFPGTSSYLHDVNVSGNNVSSNGGTGIYMATGWGTVADLYNINVSGNTISFNDGDGIHIETYSTSYPGGLVSLYDIAVSNNTISHNSRNGVYMISGGGWGGHLHYVNVSSNVVSFNEGSGILLKGWSNSRVYGARIYDVAISENVVSFCGENGVHLDCSEISIYTSGIIKNVTVFDNRLMTNDVSGIYAQSESRSNLAFDIVLLNNTMSANYLGAYIKRGTNANITDNSISYNTHGVLYDKTTDNIAHYNDIYGNRYGMNVTNGATVNAEVNYWGHSSGPYHKSLNFGLGDPVNGNGIDLDFIPFLSSPLRSINERPLATLEVDKTNPNVSETVTFNATASTDDGRLEFYFFDFGDGTNSSWTTFPVITHEYSEEGVYKATLIVMDDFGVTSLDHNFVYTKITVVPEFPTMLILLLFVIATLLAAMLHKKQKPRKTIHSQTQKQIAKNRY